MTGEKPAPESAERSRDRVSLAVWALPAVLIAAAGYEVALMLWGDYAGLEGGQSVDGEQIVTQIGYVAGLLAMFFAIAHAFQPLLPAAVALFGPATATFVTARFYAYDPHYFPQLQRYSDGLHDKWLFLLVVAGLPIAAGVLTRLRVRTGSAATGLALLVSLFASLLLGGH